MQGVGIVAIPNQFLSYILGLLAGTTEDNGIDVGIAVGNPFQCLVTVFRRHQVVDVADILDSLVALSDRHLNRILHVTFGDCDNFAWHCCREEDGLFGCRGRRQDIVEIILETHL